MALKKKYIIVNKNVISASKPSVVVFKNVFKRFFLENIIKILSNSIIKSYIYKNNISIYVKKNSLLKILFFFKNNSLCAFNGLTDITCIDFPEKFLRFTLVYNLLSFKYKTRLRINLEIAELDSVSSISSLYNGANWLEREIWDMFGVFFSNHLDLRRILTDYGFEGFPLRKDFPLMGFIEIRYDDETKRIIYEPVELTQEYRIFNFQNSWELFSKVNIKSLQKNNINF